MYESYSASSRKREEDLKKLEVFSMELNSTHLSKQVTSFNLEIVCEHGHWLTSLLKKEPISLCRIDLITKRIDKANIKKINRI